jgi:hypothetical protein
VTINTWVQRLFETQLHSLREYYGKRYELVLDELANEDTSDSLSDSEKEKKRVKQDAILTDAAKRAKEGFEIAAKNAIPSILTQDVKLLKGFERDYFSEPVLNGLLRDMIQTTSTRQEVDEMWNDVNSIDDPSETSPEEKRPRAIKWYEKVFARCLVFGVNYLQGWLAWQALRKTATDREKMMPKFPLF